MIQVMLYLFCWPITQSNALHKWKHQRCEFRLQTEFKRLKHVPLSYVNTKVNVVQPYATALWKIRSTHSCISSFFFWMAPKCSRDIIKNRHETKEFHQFESWLLKFKFQIKPRKIQLSVNETLRLKSGALGVCNSYSSSGISPWHQSQAQTVHCPENRHFHVAKTALLIKPVHLARLEHIVLPFSVSQAQVPLCSCFDSNRKSFENAGSQSVGIKWVLAEFKMGIAELADSSSHLSQC